jgi:hypothetical protein
MDESDDIQGPRPVPSLGNLAAHEVIDENLKLKNENFNLRNLIKKLLLKLPKKSRDELNKTDEFSAILNTVSSYIPYRYKCFAYSHFIHCM